MTEKPTEPTYVAELVSVIKEIGRDLGFDAEVEYKTQSGKPDVKLLYKGSTVAVIEVKVPEIPLSDPDLNAQALRYAEYYRRYHKVMFYGIHNMKYLKLFRYTPIKERKVTLIDFIKKKNILKANGEWVPVSDFPFKIMPWVSSIYDYKQISASREAKRNLEKFLLAFKDLLEGRTLDLSKEVIETIRNMIEEGAARAHMQLRSLYQSDSNIQKLVNLWLSERGLRKPSRDEELIKYLKALLKEELYTFTMKLLFYLVLQSIDAEMASRLKENIKPLEESTDPKMFKAIADQLFKYAIERSGDFEEVFGSNTVDKLPIPPASLPQLKEIINYLNQIKWHDISVDVIGRIFEGLIYEERRHLLGQHYTDTKVVDLILTGVLENSERPGELLDPACGSGTFLVRAINYWRIKHSTELDKLEKPVFEYVEGVDIDRLASMLAKINLYIQALPKIKEKYQYIPKIHHNDFFKISLKPIYEYVVTNPPYTRQEEMTLAFYDKEYKKQLRKAVSDIPNWSERASIYAYFIVRGGKLNKENGKLGYIVENSWLNAEYGKALKAWLFKNFKVEYIIESLVERWFEDADIITNIIIATKKRDNDYIARFVFLKKPLRELIGEPPPTMDFTANKQYYERITGLYKEGSSCIPKEENMYEICEYPNLRIVAVRKKFIDAVENKMNRLGIFKGPKKYLNIVLGFIEGKYQQIINLREALIIRRGLTTNANELFYLPSKYWALVREEKDYLVLKGGKRVIRINKRYLRRLIRPAHLRSTPYAITQLPSLKKEDYVLWIPNIDEVSDPDTMEYVAWMKKLIEEEYITRGKYPTLYKQINSKEWLNLPDTSKGPLLFRSAINKNFCIWLNLTEDSQIDKRFYIGYPRDEIKEKVNQKTLFAVANSILTYLGIELMGRSNLGQGALDVTTVDYEQVPIVDPLWLEDYLKSKSLFNSFITAVDRMLSLVPTDIELEARRPERLEMEKYVLGPLGFTEKDIKNLYEELIRLVKLRTERAKNK